MLREFLSAAQARRPGELLGLSLRSLAHAVRMSPPLALLLAMASVSALALLLLFWFAERNDYKATLEQGWQAAERATALTEDYTARAFEISRQVTERAASRIQSHGIDYFQDKNFGELTGLASAAPMIGSIWIFDDQGNAVADSFGPNPPECNVSDREFYRVLNDGGAAYIAGLIHGKITKELFFSYNLPVRREGRFLGIVQAKFYAENFGKFFGSLSLGAGARFGIYRDDGTPVMRWFGNWASTASNRGSTSLISHLTQASEGRFEEQAGGAEYLRAYRVLPDFNLAVSAAVVRNEALKPYWHRFRRNSAMLGLAYALLAMFAAAAYRAERRENREARIRDAAEQRLRASEARYRLLVEQCADGIFVADAEGRYVDVNPAGCAMLGFKRDEILRRTIPQVIEADERPRIGGELARLAGGGVELSEWRFRRKDGTAFIGEVLGRKLPDGRIQGIVRDITGRKQAEQRVRESEERLAAALRAGKLGVYDLDLSTGRLKWDRKVYELWGVPQDEPVTYDTFEAGVYPEDRVLVREVLKRAFDPAGAHHFECEYRIVSRSDGALRWVHADGDVYFDGEQPLRLVGAVQDITARKNIEEKLRQSEERFRGIYEYAGTGIAITTLDGAFQSCNPAYSAMLGYSERELNKLLFPALIHLDDREENMAEIARLHAQEIPSLELVNRYVAKNGKPVWVHKRVTLLRDAAGKPTHLIALVTDITERKKAEAALRESEERFRGIFENAGTGIAIADLKGSYLSCNPAFSAMLGYSQQELRALNFADLVHPDDLDANIAGRRRLLAGEIPSLEIVTRYIAKNSRTIWVHRRVSLLKDAAGKPINIIALATDMTERKRYEEHIDLLLHEVNHRSKNMLTLVQAVARQTIASKPEDFMARFGERIQALAASQDLLVKNDWRGADLEELVRSQLAHFKDLIGARVRIGGPCLLISASAAQTLGMAMHELATNAGKYGALSTTDGQVEIEWSLGVSEAGEQTFRMSWNERGGPPTIEPKKLGFGSTVLCSMVERSLDAKAGLNFAKGGLQWRLQCLASEVIEEYGLPPTQLSNPSS